MQESDLSFGQWMRKRRRELDLTQDELARRIGCAQVTIKKLEGDQLHPSKELAEAALNQLGVESRDLDSFVHFARGGPNPKTISSSTPKSNLPAELTSFIGCETEIAEVKQELKEHRLVTLTGAGGTGKTRLSLKVAEELLGEFENGIWFFELAPLAEGELIPQTILSVFKLHSDASRTMIEILTDYLAEKEILLILDNCEHMVDACAKLAITVLKSAPHLKILATSREALGIDGEVEWVVRSLSVPDIENLHCADNLTEYEAVRLFIERARLIQPRFDINDNNGQSVAQICYHLDGVPLAIELAAAQIRVMSVEQIKERLSNRFDILTSESRITLPRHKTLRAAIDWSYELLSEQEKLLLQRLSVFSGGWTLEAAEQVCSDDKLAQSNILGLMGKLTGKSLIFADETKFGKRYHILETVRQFAREKLNQTGEVDHIQKRHLEFFIGVAKQTNRVIVAVVQSASPTLIVEQYNVRAALEWSISDSGNALLGLELAGFIVFEWVFQGLGTEARFWLEQLLKRGETAAPAVYAQGLFGLAVTALYGGDPVTAITNFEQSLQLCQKTGDIAQLAQVWLGIGTYRLLATREYAEARFALEKALAFFRELNDQQFIALIESNLGWALYHLGECNLAFTHLEAGLNLGKKLDSQYLAGNAAWMLAAISLEEQEYIQCKSYLQAAVRTDIPEFSPYPMQEFGRLALRENQPERAARLFGATKHLCELTGSALLPDPQHAYEVDVSKVREILSGDVFAAAWSEGYAMFREQAIEYALKEE